MENPFDKSKVEELKKVAVEVKEIEIKPPAPVKVSKKQEILDSYGGLESNVPINSAYWKLKF